MYCKTIVKQSPWRKFVTIPPSGGSGSSSTWKHLAFRKGVPELFLYFCFQGFFFFTAFFACCAGLRLAQPTKKENAELQMTSDYLKFTYYLQHRHWHSLIYENGRPGPISFSYPVKPSDMHQMLTLLCAWYSLLFLLEHTTKYDWTVYGTPPPFPWYLTYYWVVDLRKRQGYSIFWL